MSEPIAFPSTTANFSLPLLFLGQAQKEPFINHALSLVDALLAGVVTSSLAIPPSDPPEGHSYRILAGANNEWAGHDDEIALWIGGAWEFVTPSIGLSVFDQAEGIQLRYDGSWQSAIEPSTPTGGSTIDTEARAAISELIDALRAAHLV